MSRQKQVFKADELTVLFLKQTQEMGRTGKSSTGQPAMFFEGNKLYSYGYHFLMGRVEGNTLIMSERNSSVTTNKHLHSLYLDAKTAGFKVIVVDNPAADNIEDNASNLEALENNKASAEHKASRARAEHMVSHWNSEASTLATRISDYVEYLQTRAEVKQAA